MRSILMGLLMAASAATPLAAQSDDVVMTERYQRLGDRNAARAERRQERVEARSDGAAAQRFEQRQQRAVQQPSPVVGVQQQQSWQGNYDRRAERREYRQDLRQDRQDGRRDVRQDRRDERRDSLREQIEASREASRRSAEGLPPNYQRQAARNQQRYEERLREQARDQREWRQDRREDRREWRQDARQDRRYARNWQRDWNRGWRGDRRYDWQSWRNANRYLYSPGRYYAPYRGYNYRRFSAGLFLQPLFYSDRYWLSDPWQYRLPAAYAGTQWVRYYDDVLLVDLYTGEVVDVIYNFFW